MCVINVLIVNKIVNRVSEIIIFLKFVQREEFMKNIASNREFDSPLWHISLSERCLCGFGHLKMAEVITKVITRPLRLRMSLT